MFLTVAIKLQSALLEHNLSVFRIISLATTMGPNVELRIQNTRGPNVSWF